MQLQIRSRSIELTDALRAHVERHLQFALSRFGDRIGRVTVHLVDAGGPGAGGDKTCRIDVTLRPSGEVVVEDTQADLHAAIDRATERTGRSVTRELEIDRVFDGSAARPRGSRNR